MEELKKVWFVAIIWRPNSWKSTFLNTLLKEKVSIVSPKPQTTQKSIKWIYNDSDSQIIFLDTPWLNNWQELFQKSLKQIINNSIKQADIIVRFIDSSREYWQEEIMIENLLNTIKKPIINVYSKFDITKIKNNNDFLTISSINNLWINNLINEIKKFLSISHPFYENDYYTDQDIYSRISEIIKEKIFLNFKDEIPYSIFVETDEIDEHKDCIKILAYLYTERESQKIIIIWQNGQNLKKILSQSKKDLNQIFNKKIVLILKIKILPKWKKNNNFLKKFLK